MRNDTTAGKRRFASMSRRAAITAAALAAMTTLAGCGGGGAASAEGDMALGAPDGAKVTVVEYASVTCGVCAAWHEQVWPEFKTKYVDTNQVRFIFREFPTPPQEVAAAGFMVARCAGEDKYFNVISELMASQREWAAGVAPAATLRRVANAAGLNNEQYEACVRDANALKAMDERIRAAGRAGVSGTPTFMVNGKIVADKSLEGISAAVDAALAES